MAGPLADARDIYCLDALQPGRVATGKDLLAQRLYHRLTTPAGTLRGGEDEASFGLDLAGYVGRTEERQLGSMLPVVVRNELLKDDAVAAVDVLAVRSEGAGLVTWTLTLTIDSAVGDLELVLAVSEVTVEILGVR